MPVSIIILLMVLTVIALRRFIRFAVPIWAIMTGGAVAAILLKQISPLDALTAIEPGVMIYLFGVFLISQAIEESGYLEHITDNIFHYVQNGKQALFIIIFIFSFGAALLMNDTIAIIGTPIILQLCKAHKHLIKPLLFALAFAITIGSVVSPIGNPQNLLIAVKGELHSPFIDFISILIVPTMINLLIAFLYMLFIYRNILNEPLEKPILEPIKHYKTARLAKISLMIMIILIMVKIISDFSHSVFQINFSYIAIISALPILFSKKRWVLIKKLNWGTLIFFISTFILTQSVWDGGFFQSTIHDLNISVTTIPIILMTSIILSQFISNVPLVALYLPILLHHQSSMSHLLALAAGSTIAGNLSLLGAASNIIIIQNAEKRGVKGFNFFEFVKVGLPLTIVNALVYACFL